MSAVKIIVFFHNVECMYFKELIKATGKKRHYITLNAVEKNEKGRYRICGLYNYSK